MSSAIGTFSDTAVKILQKIYELAEMLVAKNADYGDSAFKPPVMCPSMSSGGSDSRSDE
jgi:hypothetical protein